MYAQYKNDHWFAITWPKHVCGTTWLDTTTEGFFQIYTWKLYHTTWSIGIEECLFIYRYINSSLLECALKHCQTVFSVKRPTGKLKTLLVINSLLFVVDSPKPASSFFFLPQKQQLDERIQSIVVRVEEFQQQLDWMHQNMTSTSEKMSELYAKTQQLHHLFNRIDQVEVTEFFVFFFLPRVWRTCHPCFSDRLLCRW